MDGLKKNLPRFFCVATSRIPFFLGIFLLSLFNCNPVFSQIPSNNVIEGVVVDKDNNPLIGVTVSAESSTAATMTDISGKFSIRINPENPVLKITSVGYKTQTVRVSTSSIKVLLEEDDRFLDEVVVVGYGTTRKKDLTGAVSVIDTKDLSKSGAGTVTSALQGLATGVTVRSSGNAGADASIEIRGVGSLSNNNPLWVVDGLITSAGTDFNPNDIESIQILKDASAAAIYGSRAANGVIIVTTKKGKSGPMKIDVSARESIEWSPRYDLMNADEFKKYNDMAYAEGIKDGVYTGSYQNHWNNNTDWQDAVLKNALVQDYNVSLSGGNETGNYLVSGGLYNNDGLVYGNSFKRLSFRVNTEGKKGIFSFGESFAFSHTDRDPTVTSSYIDMVRMLPTIPIYDANNPGGYGYGSEANARTFGTNPIAREDLEQTNTKIYRFRGSVWGEVKIFDFLKYKLNVGIDYLFDDYSYFRKEGNWTLNQEHRDPTGNKSHITEKTELIENTLTFDKNFAKHHVDALVGMTYQHYYWEQLGGQRLKFPYLGGQYFTVLDAGQSNQTNFNSIGENALVSYLGRINYIYDDKYYLTATIRRDGTSRLSVENRWKNFPSISGAWRMSNENFFNVPWINDFKLRANYGQLGNAAIGNWDYIPTIAPSIVTVFGTSQSLVNGATQVRLNNTDLRWEIKEQTNIGFDASVIDQHLTLAAEYYIATTRDVLTAMPIAISTGNQGGAPVANAASLRNSGFEFTAIWRDKIDKVDYSVTLNATTVKNKILDLGYGKEVYYTSQTRSEIGRALGEYYLLKTDGIFKSQDQIDAYVTSSGTPITIEGKRPQLGDVKYIDTDDNGLITTEDRQIVGNPWADLMLSLNFNVAWNNFDFSMFWYGQFGNDVLNGGMRQGRYFADNSNYIRFESGHEPYQENPNSDFPRIIYGDTRNTRGDSDMWLEDGSFLRMKTIQLGYNVPNSITNKIGINGLRAYVSGSNLFTITKYKGLDPDFVNTDVWDRGTDNMGFANPRSVVFGLQFSF